MLFLNKGMKNKIWKTKDSKGILYDNQKEDLKVFFNDFSKKKSLIKI